MHKRLMYDLGKPICASLNASERLQWMGAEVSLFRSREICSFLVTLLSDNQYFTQLPLSTSIRDIIETLV